jgi:S-adenosylmethionine hydrolase
MITLATDFGSPYPAAMKGVICGQSDARIEDIAHDLPRQDVRAAAFWLTQTLPYFPPAVHCVVVDPGVGTDRAALVVRADDHALVGPDNGVLLPAVRELTEDGFEVFRWAYDDPASSTFHGRDVFAPAAATVHNHGVAGLDELPRASRTDDYVDLRFPAPTVNRDGVKGEVLVVDDFGNAITNVSREELDASPSETVEVNGQTAPVHRAYAAVGPGQPLVTVGSHGNVELAVNRGRGDDAFGVTAGDTIELHW